MLLIEPKKYHYLLRLITNGCLQTCLHIAHVVENHLGWGQQLVEVVSAKIVRVLIDLIQYKVIHGPIPASSIIDVIESKTLVLSKIISI